MESFSVDEISNYTNSIITFVLNGASTKLPLKEKDMTNTLNIKGKSFIMALNHAKSALKEVNAGTFIKTNDFYKKFIIFLY